MAKNSQETRFLHRRNGPTDRRTDGPTNRRTDGPTDRRTDRPTGDVHPHPPTTTYTHKHIDTHAYTHWRFCAQAHLWCCGFSTGKHKSLPTYLFSYPSIPLCCLAVVSFSWFYSVHRFSYVLKNRIINRCCQNGCN